MFGVIFAAQSSKSTWKSLLLYSITLRNPLFAELAASDKVNKDLDVKQAYPVIDKTFLNQKVFIFFH